MVRWTRILNAQGLVGPALAGRTRRHRLDADPAVHLPGRDPAGAGAADAALRPQHGRAGDLHLRQRRAEGEVPAAHRQHGRLVVPGLLRAGRRLRPREPVDQGRARGDHYVVNGQKTWTTLGQHADWIFCLVRTDPNAPKKQMGISFLLIDMTTPGVTVRPIQTIDGGHEVNEVFFDDVQGAGREPRRRGEQGLGLRQVPARPRARRHRPGRRLEGAHPPAEGDRPARIFRPHADLGEPPLPREGRRRRDRAEGAGDDAAARRLGRRQAGQPRQAGPGLLDPEDQGLGAAAGDDRALDGGDRPLRPSLRGEAAEGRNEPPVGPDYAAPLAPAYFNYRKVSIYGGSNEIQKNIIAKAILGL